MIFNIINLFNLPSDQKKQLLTTHLFYKKLVRQKQIIQENPFDTNYRIIRMISKLNVMLYNFEKCFVLQVNKVLIDKLFFNFHYKDIKKDILNEVFYNDITNIIVDFTNFGEKLIFIKLNNNNKLIILKNVNILKNLIRYEFITEIYIEKYNINEGMTLLDFQKKQPVYSYENLTLVPTDPNYITRNPGIYSLILVELKFVKIKNKFKHKMKSFYISSIDQLYLIEKCINKTYNKCYFCNFVLYAIKSVEKDYMHKIHLNLQKIQADIFTMEIYDFLINLLIETNKTKY
jgi:hypothetical protein